MKIFDREGEVYTADFDAEALYDLVKGMNATNAVCIIRVKTLLGLNMQIHLQEVNVSRSLEEAIMENFPYLDLDIPEAPETEPCVFDTLPPVS